MGPYERLVDALRTRISVKSKLDAIIGFEQIHDPRVTRLFLSILENPREPEEVRAYILQHLRCTSESLAPAERDRVANAFNAVLAEESSPGLQLQAALALGDFTEVDGVLSRLNAICLMDDASIDLRYAAFTSIERAGPIAESIALLRRMTSDETIGPSARSVLSAWHID
jgi:hypothetical protein